MRPNKADDCQGAAHRVLIMMDMPYQARLFQEFLEEAGRETTVVVGVEEGLQILGQCTYDAVVVDADFGSGLVENLVARLRLEFPALTIVILVGWWDQRSVEMGNYADLLMYKPPHRPQIQEMFGKHAGVCAAPKKQRVLA